MSEEIANIAPPVKEGPASELWQLRGAFWRIPIWVTPGEIWKVDISAVHLLECQKKAVVDLLSQHAVGVGNIWWITPDVLEIMAEKTDRTSYPDKLLVWCPGDANTRFIPEVADFAKDYCKAGGPFPEALTVGVWLGLCRYALHTLVNLQKPIHMGFCTLIPLMLRPNWQNVLLSREKSLFKSSGPAVPKNPDKIIRCELTDHLISGDLIAMENDLPAWGVTIDLLEPFYQQSTVTEKAARKRYGPQKYWMAVRETLKRQLPYAVRLYHKFLREAMRPGVRLPGKSVAGSAEPGGELYFRVGDTKSMLRGLFDDRDCYKILQSAAQNGTPTPSALPEKVSPLQPGTEDVWDGWGDMVQSDPKQG